MNSNSCLEVSSVNIVSEKSHNDERSSSRPRGWLNWLSRGMLGAGGTDDSSQFSGAVSDDVIKVCKPQIVTIHFLHLKSSSTFFSSCRIFMRLQSSDQHLLLMGHRLGLIMLFSLKSSLIFIKHLQHCGACMVLISLLYEFAGSCSK